MSYCSISIFRYSGTNIPKSFSGEHKDKVIEAFKDYVDDHIDTYQADCYIKVTKDGITAISHERDPHEALKDACNKLYNGTPDIQFSNMAVVTEDDVEEDGDDLDKVDEDEVIDEEDEIDPEPIDPDDVPDDRKIDGDVVSGEWDGLIEDED